MSKDQNRRNMVMQGTVSSNKLFGTSSSKVSPTLVSQNDTVSTSSYLERQYDSTALCSQYWREEKSNFV